VELSGDPVARNGRHHDRAHGGTRDRDRDEDLRRQARLQQADQHEWPDQIELLLDRQRPRVSEVQQRQQWVVLDDEVPVEPVQRRPQRLDAHEVRDPAGQVDRRVQEHRQEHDRERGQEPERAPCVERAQADARAALVLLDQQRRDQEPAEDEEDVDAEEAAVHVERRAADQGGVEQHDGEHGDGPHAVERGPVAEVERPPLPCRRHLSP
jgi:hypothetical protein